MRVALVAVASAMLLLGIGWLWLASEPPGGWDPAGVTEVGRPADGTGAHPSPPPPDRDAAGDRGGLASEGRVDGAGATARDAAAARARGPSAIGDGSRGSGPRSRKQRLEQLREIARGQGADSDVPIDFAGPGANPDDLESFDLDADGALTPWELARAKQLLERAERHPLDSDLDDAAYPIEAESYDEPAWEFEAMDANRDGLLELDEYYSFLVDSLRRSIALDRNGDNGVDRAESGLRDDQFEAFDRDGSGSLKFWEVRQAMARGAWDRESEVP